jgi:hypothetical protein
MLDVQHQTGLNAETQRNAEERGENEVSADLVGTVGPNERAVLENALTDRELLRPERGADLRFNAARIWPSSSRRDKDLSQSGVFCGSKSWRHWTFLSACSQVAHARPHEQADKNVGAPPNDSRMRPFNCIDHVYCPTFSPRVTRPKKKRAAALAAALSESNWSQSLSVMERP